jgi:L-lactate dehydrogenase (cytochrome)/glycolate oxidase
MATAWFESVAVAQRRARKRLPASVYSALMAGSERGQTRADNIAAFAELGFAPHVAGNSPQRDLATTVLGQPVSLPVIISPTGVQAVHPDGEVAVARAAAARGTVMGLSSFASKPVEEVVAANPQTFFQMYWCGSRDQILARMERARKAGAVGLILTADWTFSHSRDWGSPQIPDRIDLRAALRHAPEVLARPQWLASFARTLKLPDLTVPNMAPPDGPAPTFFGAYGEWMQTPPPAWADVAWLREQWAAPFLLKGVSRVDDAKRAVDAGVSAISVSNHGGNNVDGTPATIRALPAVAEAARQRRGQGARARRARRHDRPGLPVGSGGWRAGRGRERAGYFPERGRFHPPRAWPVLGARADTGRPADPARLRAQPRRAGVSMTGVMGRS